MRRHKSNKSDAMIESLLEQDAQAEQQRRLPRALRWARPDRDEGIRAAQVVLVDPHSNTLSEPRGLAHVLRDIDRSSHFVIRVGTTSGSGNRDLPICKIMRKKDVFELEAKKARSQTDARKEKRRREGKTMEVGWATADSDLLHRFRKARQALDGGDRVNFVIENRQRRTEVPDDSARLMLERIRAAMKEVPLCFEVGLEGQLGKKMKLVFGIKGVD